RQLLHVRQDRVDRRPLGRRQARPSVRSAATLSSGDDEATTGTRRAARPASVVDDGTSVARLVAADESPTLPTMPTIPASGRAAARAWAGRGGAGAGAKRARPARGAGRVGGTPRGGCCGAGGRVGQKRSGPPGARRLEPEGKQNQSRLWPRRPRRIPACARS